MDQGAPGSSGVAYRKVNRDDVLQAVVAEWEAASKLRSARLQELLREHDTNGDGVLQFDEFEELCRSLPGGAQMDTPAILQLFRDALNSGAGDVDDYAALTPAAFAEVAARHALLPDDDDDGDGGVEAEGDEAAQHDAALMASTQVAATGATRDDALSAAFASIGG